MVDHLASRISYGEKLFHEGKVEEALGCFSSLLKSSPDCPELLNNLGVISFSARRFEEAEQHFLAAIGIDKGYREAYKNLAKLYSATNDVQKAVATLEGYPFSGPHDFAICNQLGLLYLSLKDIEKAKTSFEKSLKLRPARNEAKSILEEILRLQAGQEKPRPKTPKAKTPMGKTLPKAQTVALVAESHLCLSCGACTVACPVDAVRLIETPDGRLIPQVDEQACILCGRCLQVCPGVAISDIEDFLSHHQPFQGPCLGAFVGRSSDPVIYRKAQSGGVVTAIALELLKTNYVDGVVVSRLEWEGGRARGRAFIARSRDELLSAQGSKYCPMPLLQALRSEGRPPARLAFVGLPCHVHAIRNLRRWQPELVENVQLTIGLFCDRVLTYAAMEYLARRANLSLSEISQFFFRDKARTGYPGDVVILTKEGELKALPNNERMRIKDHFTPLRCRLCFDKLNVFSDISVGDPYGVQGTDNENGESVCVARTDKGKKALALCVQNQVIRIREIDYRQVLAGQGIREKTAMWHAFARAWERMGGPLPGYTHDVLPLCRYVSSEDQRHASILVQSLQQERCTSREELVSDAGIRLGEQEPYYGSVSERHFIVEIMGCGFVNKGAMLMMLAIIGQLHRRRPDAKITSVPMPWMKRFLDYGILPLLPGFLDQPDIDVVLDASGFAYSDQWGAAPSKVAARKFERLKAYGATIILLPQAFGPFQEPAIRDSFKKIADSAELIFARDEISLEHVRAVVGESSKVGLAPDFTVMIEGIPPREHDWYGERVCIVPNARMLDKTSGKEHSQYIEFLKKTIVVTRRLGREAFFLIHEGCGDYEIARAINGLMEKGCKIIYEQDPLLLKGILGASAAVVSSRYHALIGSLSQAVPSLCVGWSHKYHQLFKSYEFTEGLFQPDATEDQLQAAIVRMLDGETRLQLVARLRSASDRQKELAGEMWQRVFQCMGKAHPPSQAFV